MRDEDSPKRERRIIEEEFQLSSDESDENVSECSLITSVQSYELDPAYIK